MDTRYTPENESGEGLRVLVRPNRSLSLRAMAVLFAGIAIFVITIGVGFTQVGAWLVLPFAGLEVAVVGAALFLLYRRVDDHDLVIIHHDRVIVVRRERGRDRCEEFQRYWVKVHLEPGGDGFPSRLTIGSHGRYVTIGAEVSDEERSEIGARLNELLHRT